LQKPRNSQFQTVNRLVTKAECAFFRQTPAPQNSKQGGEIPSLCASGGEINYFSSAASADFQNNNFSARRRMEIAEIN
jgi:hypothetical protein